MIPTVSPDALPRWSWLRGQYPEVGIPGLSAGEDHVLWRNGSGRVVGVLEIRLRRRFMVVVDPRYRRRGVATRLLREALGRWPEIDLKRERYTPNGAAWIQAFVRPSAAKEERNG